MSDAEIYSYQDTLENLDNLLKNGMRGIDSTNGDWVYRDYSGVLRSSPNTKRKNNGTWVYNPITLGALTLRSVSRVTNTKLLSIDENGLVNYTQAVDLSLISGDGTSGYLAAFTGTNSLGNSIIFMSGTKLGINTATPLSELHVHSTQSPHINFSTSLDSSWSAQIGLETGALIVRTGTESYGGFAILDTNLAFTGEQSIFSCHNGYVTLGYTGYSTHSVIDLYGSTTVHGELYATTIRDYNLTANKVVFTDSNKYLTSTGIGASTQFIKADGSLDSTSYMATASYPDLIAIEALTGTTGLLKKTAANTWTLDTTSYMATASYPDLIAIEVLTGTTGLLKKTAANTWTLDTTSYMATASYPDLTAIEELTGTTGLLKKTAANTWTLDTSIYLTGNQTITLSGVVTGSGTTAITTVIADAALSIAKTSGLQPALDAKMSTASYPDLTAIEALTGTTGLLKKTAANTWTLDTSTYLTTAVTSLVATSPIVTSASTGAVTLTHATSGVTAGTYKSITVNSYGHVTGGTNPTTLAGYGITDAMSGSGTATYLPIFTAARTISNSLFSSNGASILLSPNVSSDNYNAGLRITRSTAGYSLIALGCAAGTYAGTQAGQWTFYVQPTSGNSNLIFDCNGTLGMEMSTTGNVAFGNSAVKNWSTTFRALQVGGTCSIMSRAAETNTGELYILGNCYFNGLYTAISGVSGNGYATIERRSVEGYTWFGNTGLSANDIISPVRLMSLDYSGNLSVGSLAPRAWHADSYQNIQTGTNLYLGGGRTESGSVDIIISNNTYVNTSSQWIAPYAGSASIYNQYLGTHGFYCLPSVTANSQLTVTRTACITKTFTIFGEDYAATATATPYYIDMGKSYANDTAEMSWTKCKFFLYRDGNNDGYGFGVGDHSDIFYCASSHTNGSHNFYIGNGLYGKLSAVGLYVNGNLDCSNTKTVYGACFTSWNTSQSCAISSSGTYITLNQNFYAGPLNRVTHANGALTLQAAGTYKISFNLFASSTTGGQLVVQLCDTATPEGTQIYVTQAVDADGSATISAEILKTTVASDSYYLKITNAQRADTIYVSMINLHVERLSY